MHARHWIERLQLAEHPEGGFFRETYRSDETIPPEGLPGRFGGPRPASTAIYFLITGTRPSRFHRMKADEVWHFYDGQTLTLHLLYPDGRYETKLLGRSIEMGERFQAVVPAGCWFGATVEWDGDYALAGCTVAPGFDFDDFTFARRSELLAAYPQHAALIERLTIPETDTDDNG